MKTWRVIVMLALAIVTSGPAQAQSSYRLDETYSEVGDWIVGWNAERRYCLMLTGYTTGVVVLIGVDPYRESVILSFFHKEWRSIEEKRRYSLELVFDNRRRWSGMFRGTKAVFGSGFEADNLTLEFMRDIAIYYSVRITISGRDLGRYSLAGTQAALRETIQCSRDNLDREAATPPPTVQPPALATPAQPPRPPRLGVTVRELPTERKAILGGYGLIVDAVMPGSIASMAGIQAGDIIRYMTGHQVTTPANFAEAVRQIPAQKPILIEIMRGDAVQVLSVTFP